MTRSQYAVLLAAALTLGLSACAGADATGPSTNRPNLKCEGQGSNNLTC
jgi:hypothetical protein